jgi:prevent-host-death family protein
MDTVNLYEAKTNLSALVERAARGEEIVIAKAGRPLARLVPLARLLTGDSTLRRYEARILGSTGPLQGSKSDAFPPTDHSRTASLPSVATRTQHNDR